MLTCLYEDDDDVDEGDSEGNVVHTIRSKVLVHAITLMKAMMHKNNRPTISASMTSNLMNQMLLTSL